MHSACAEWLTRWDWRGQAGARMLTDEQLRELLQRGYLAGYEDGRASMKPQ